MSKDLLERIKEAINKDPEIACPKDDSDKTFGSNPLYLEEQLGINKKDLIKLEKYGFAVKARYETKAGHRIRWIIFSEVLDHDCV